jgi:DNA-binding cell septation regulator SpoVG
LACSNVKADKKLNIEIYTIRVIDGNSGLLQKCASDTSKYSDVQDPKNLEQVFAKIAQDLSKLRLAK